MIEGFGMLVSASDNWEEDCMLNFDFEAYDPRATRIRKMIHFALAEINKKALESERSV